VTAPDPLISLSDVRVSRGGRAVLAIAAWRVETRAHVLVEGPSGSGKSTLLSAIAGLLQPDAGAVVVDGADITALSEAERDRFRAGRVGIVFQTLRLVRTLTIAENLALALRLARRPVERDRIRDTLDRLGIADKMTKRPHQLSVGEAQRAAIARAVVARPRLLLADEPTSALDDANARRAIDLLIAEAQSCGATLVVASHDGRIRDRFDATLSLEARG
jgi:putative ABC transport system ATP-binding protein